MKHAFFSILLIFIPILAKSNPVEIEGIYYNLINKAKTAEVTSNPNKYIGNVLIPETVEYEGNIYDVKSIGEDAFYNCISLSSIYIPRTITIISSNAFYGCSHLQKVIIQDIAAWCSIDFGDNPLYYAKHLFSDEKTEIINLIIPNGVTAIVNSAFTYCEGITSVTMPNSVKIIGNSAFAHCSNLVSTNIPQSVTSIGNYAFCGTSLTTITIPQYVSEIGRESFCGTKLSSVIIEEGITSIGDMAFYRCANLSSVSLPNSITSIKWAAFEDCYALKSITLPQSLIFIGADAFRGSGLTSVIIPDNVISIDDRAFKYCKYLTSIILGRDLTIINDEVFSECPELKDIYCYAEELPTIGENVFKGSYIEYATLHIPLLLERQYKETDPWSRFGSIKVICKLKYFVDGELYKVYEIEEGTVIDPETEPTKEGYTFSGWSDLPGIMPDNDVIVSGYFTINKYKLTFIVDGEEYKLYEIEYGATIMAEEEPTKEGYTFSGWSDIPESMPANDVIVSGSFTINNYRLTYIVDGEEYKSYEVEFGAPIIPEAEPTKEGYIFTGWSDIPETMPAHDVIIYANFETGIHDISIIQSIIRIYSSSGKQLEEFVDGLNIVILKDGSVKKVIIKKDD